MNQLETKSHLVYLIGHNLDMGLNFVDLPLRIGDGAFLSYNDDINRKPLYPILMFTIQKQLNIRDNLQINAGLQIGANVSNSVENK